MPNIHTLSDHIKAAVVAHGITATATSAALTAQGYDGVLFLLVGTTDGTGKVDLKVTECDTSGGSYADVTGAAITQIPINSTAVTAAIDMKLSKRKAYLKTVTTIVANATVEVIALFYNGDLKPETFAAQVVKVL